MKQLLKLSSIIHKIQIKNKTSLPELSMSVRLTFFSGWNRRDFHGSHLMIICVIKSSPQHRNETIFLFLLILMTDFPMIIISVFGALAVNWAELCTWFLTVLEVQSLYNCCSHTDQLTPHKTIYLETALSSSICRQWWNRWSNRRHSCC